MKTQKNKIINFHRPSIGVKEINEVIECLKSGWLTTGSRTKTFEAKFAEYIPAKFAVALNSCTAALHLALEAMGTKENDIVIVPTMTFAATAEVVRYLNAIPVFVDSLEDDFCIDTAKTKECIDEIKKGKHKKVPAEFRNIKAVIPVDFGGFPADINKIRKITDENGASLIQDCAHACPAFYKNEDGKMVKSGSEADIACYSFYANKTITTGEGGMAITNNPEYENRMRIMSLHGISRDAWQRFTSTGTWRYEIIAPGYKYNMTDIAASIGIHQLNKADKFREQRAKIAKKYTQLLKDTDLLILPKEKPDTISSWHLFPVRIQNHRSKSNRDETIEKMKKYGIVTSVHYIPLHMHKYYTEKYGYKPGDFPVAEKLSSECISLPIYPGMRDSQIERVATTLLKILRGELK